MKSRTLEQKNKVDKSFSKISLLVNKSNEMNFKLDEYAWAWFTVNTRAVYFKDSNYQKYPNTCQVDLGDDHENLALAPFLDLFNHSSKADVEAGFNLQHKVSESYYTIKTNTKYRKYDQVFINYGPHCNLRLYLEYGFSEENNDNDFIPVTAAEVIDIFISNQELSSEDIFVQNALAMVEKTKLHENLRIDNNGPSWNVAALFYVMNNIYCSMKTMNNGSLNSVKWQNVFMIADFSDNTEITSLLLLLVNSKLSESKNCIINMKEKISRLKGTSKCTKSFEAAFNLLTLHNFILESAVRCLAQNQIIKA